MDTRQLLRERERVIQTQIDTIRYCIRNQVDETMRKDALVSLDQFHRELIKARRELYRRGLLEDYGANYCGNC